MPKIQFLLSSTCFERPRRHQQEEYSFFTHLYKVKQSRYRPTWRRAVQEVKAPQIS